ncbi:ankyrin repeat domain-containing protein [Alteromonadaceae bacterium M269]|nr:ankyrin repeat domain-containing protein [Alteromonadaceae bacterium M269]
MSTQDSSNFYLAVKHIIEGKRSELISLLNTDPTLVSERSHTSHKATLLHYVSANGVEDELQHSPANAAEITQVLLDAGAEADALAQSYGGGPAQTPLSLLVSSYPPYKAKVQVPVARALVKGGAKVDGINNEGTPLATAIAFGYKEVAAELVRLGAKVQCIQIAAALGVQETVDQFFDSKGVLLKNAGVNESQVIPSKQESQKALDSALWYACLHDQLPIAEFLLTKGAKLEAKGPEGFTALHSAAVRGSTDILQFLLDNNASTEVTNDYDGTPLDTLCWFANNVKNDAIDYVSIASMLLKHGALASAISPYPTGHNELDSLIERYRK